MGECDEVFASQISCPEGNLWQLFVLICFSGALGQASWEHVEENTVTLAIADWSERFPSVFSVLPFFHVLQFFMFLFFRCFSFSLSLLFPTKI